MEKMYNLQSVTIEITRNCNAKCIHCIGKDLLGNVIESFHVNNGRDHDQVTGVHVLRNIPGCHRRNEDRKSVV